MTFRSALGVAALLAVTLACQPAPEQQASAPPDPAPINALRDQYAAMYNSGEVAGIGDLYTDDAVVMNDQQPAAQGKQAIQQQAQALVDQFSVNISITPVDTQIVNDVAYEHGSYSMSLTPKAGGDPMQNSGNYIVILKRGADGAWKLHREIGNSNQPPAAP